MANFSINLHRKELDRLKASAIERGMTVSALVREIIRNSSDQQDISAALSDIRIALSAVTGQKHGAAGSLDSKQLEQALEGLQQEIKALSGTVAGRGYQTTGNGTSENVVEIKRIVTLIGQAMPSVAKQL